MKAFGAAICASFVLVACATKRETTVAADQGKTVRYSVPADVAAGLNEAALTMKYAEAVKAASGLPPERIDSDGVATGVRVNAVPGGVNVAYLRQKGPTLYHNLIGRFGVTSTRQGGQVAIDVSCPAAARQESSSFTGLYSPFIEPAKVAADLRSICDRANLLFERRETGEIDVPYNDASVNANFKRKLAVAQAVRLDVRQGDSSRFAWYSLNDGARNAVVGVHVYPYRNGSKVTYVWTNIIACRPNAACNFDPMAAKRVSDAIAAVAND